MGNLCNRYLISESLHIEEESVDDSGLQQNPTNSSLKFTASFTHKTPAILLPSFEEKEQTLMDSFFQSEEFRTSIFTGSGNMQCYDMDLGADGRVLSLLQKQRERELSYFSPYNSNGFSLYSPDESSTSGWAVKKLVITTGFLVFTIDVIAAIAEEFRLDESSDANVIALDDNPSPSPSLGRQKLPEYRVILLAETFEATKGPAPLLWIFNQLTSMGRKEGNSTSLFSEDSLKDPHTFHSYLQVKAVVSRDKNADGQAEVVFHGKSRAEVEIFFPSLLLKLLPAPKEFIEDQGSNALQSNMERDVVPGIDLLRESFMKWIQS